MYTSVAINILTLLCSQKKKKKKRVDSPINLIIGSDRMDYTFL